MGCEEVTLVRIEGDRSSFADSAAVILTFDLAVLGLLFGMSSFLVILELPSFLKKPGALVTKVLLRLVDIRDRDGAGSILIWWTVLSLDRDLECAALTFCS